MRFRSNMQRLGWLVGCLGGVFAVACSSDPATETLGIATQAATSLTWKGHTWRVTAGGMAGVAQGSTDNVSVDAKGYLHLKIANSAGTWTAAELFTIDKLGLGTYQWQIDGPIDRFDKNVVLGLYPYGPAAGIGVDGTNEIDIEYSFWGNANGVNGDWTNYPASGTTIGELSYKFSLNGGTFSTSRFIWTKNSIQDFLIDGFEPVGSTANLIKTWTYAPANPIVNIPQQALPLGINLWCFQAPPSNGQNVEVVIRDFQFVPEGTVIDAGGGAGGSDSGAAGGGGRGGAGGTPGAGGTRTDAGGAGGAGSAGGAGGAGGTTGGGAPSAGGSQGTVDAATNTAGPAGVAGSVAAGDSHVSGGVPPTSSTTGNENGCSCRIGRATTPHHARWLLAGALVVVRLRRRHPTRAGCAASTPSSRGPACAA